MFRILWTYICGHSCLYSIVLSFLPFKARMAGATRRSSRLRERPCRSFGNVHPTGDVNGETAITATVDCTHYRRLRYLKLGAWLLGINTTLHAQCDFLKGAMQQRHLGKKSARPRLIDDCMISAHHGTARTGQPKRVPRMEMDRSVQIWAHGEIAL